MSLIAMMVIVVIVGGIAAAFFLLSQIESRQAEGARTRIKAYYLGEAAVEQVASLIKVATASFWMPKNPADPATPGDSTTSTGVLASGGPVYNVTYLNAPGSTVGINGVLANFCFQHLDVGTNQWIPYWNMDKTSNFYHTWGWWDRTNPANPQWRGTGNMFDPKPYFGDASNMRFYLACELTMLLEPHSVVPGVDALNSETFAFEASNFNNLTGVGVGNTGAKNYYTVTVEGRVQHYDVAGQASATRGAHVSITRELEISNNSILPFFAFFNSDLEFLPGPRFVGNGKIHTNKDLYIGGATSIDMNSDYIGAVGQMYRHRMNDGSYTENAGPLTIHQMVPGTPTPGQLGAGAANWDESIESASMVGNTLQTNQNWANQLNNNGLSPTVQQGASTMQVPPVGSIQPPPSAGAKGGDLYEWAKNTSPDNGVKSGLILSVDTTGAVTALYNNGSGQFDVTNTLTSQGVLTTNSITDNRQSQSQKLSTTVVDMGKLKTSGYFPSNGILYASDARNGSSIPGVDAQGNATLLPPSPPPQVASGFVFMDGKTIPAPVNIVSNGPVYIQGDFNIPTVDPNTGAAMPKQPAAVIADAINLLSNAWDNSKAPGGAPPNASETSYNFAMVTGQVPTVPGQQYSGGLENLPRFQENWGGVNCNYRGSLINLWTSAIATGAWGQNNVYSPPNRNWDWDSAFGTTTASQVPGFPRAISISRTIYTMDYWGAGGSGAYRAVQ
jgi:hypothetical protein